MKCSVIHAFVMAMGVHFSLSLSSSHRSCKAASDLVQAVIKSYGECCVCMSNETNHHDRIYVLSLYFNLIP